MEVFFSGETDASSGVGKVVEEFNRKRREYFDGKHYGDDIARVSIFLICRVSKVRQRIRFSRKDKVLYIDIILDLVEFQQYDPAMRIRVAASYVLSELPAIIGKYKFKDFSLDRFMADLSSFLLEKSESVRIDRLMH